MSTPNYPIKDADGNEHWISRSVAVAIFTYKWVGRDLYVLLERRGQGVDHSGELCCPCGYLDWDETLEEAVQRELKEETGISSAGIKIHQMNINSDPSENRQNVTVRYVVFLPSDTEPNIDSIITKDEIDSVGFVKIGELASDKVDTIYLHTDIIVADTFAFGHDKRIVEMLKLFYKNKYTIIETDRDCAEKTEKTENSERPNVIHSKLYVNGLR